METAQAIRKLLFLEDCVIIPGLGGFVSQYRPAVIDSLTGTFIPPTKEIVFNNELVQNDGTLVKFVAEKNGISVDLARVQVDFFVDEAKKKLKHDIPVFIVGIGQFVQDRNHKVRFQADAGINLLLNSFGLATFHLREVIHETGRGLNDSLDFRAEELPKTVEFPVAEIKVSHLKRNLGRIAIAMPLLIAFSLMPYHSRVADILTSSTASMIPEPSLVRLSYPDAPGSNAAKVVVFPIQEIGKGETVTSDTVTSDRVTSDRVIPKEAKEVKEVPGKFPVIAGCFKVKSNAERLQKQLTDKGYPASITTSRKGFYKVSVQSFASRAEALTGLDRLRKAEPGMELWLAM